MVLIYLYLSLLYAFGWPQSGKEGLFITYTGSVTFISDAPLETITARSTHLKGVIDTSNNSFAFTLDVSSFVGFNSPLQREHFNENYMESAFYPTATFKGKIIEAVSYKLPGTYEVRAKGTLNIHGIPHERLIRAQIEVKPNQISVEADFMVSLANHNIKIPRIVNQKISPDIKVSVSANLKKFEVK